MKTPAPYGSINSTRKYIFKAAFPPEELHEIFTYDLDTGELRWRVSRSGRALVGALAGTITPTTGYRDVNFSGHRKAAHRIIWAMMTGKWPHMIDHKNRIRTDNRWSNLREVNASVNGTNKKIRSDSRSGVQYVLRNRTSWAVVRKFKGVKIFSGYYSSFDAAVAAAAVAAKLSPV